MGIRDPIVSKTLPDIDIKPTGNTGLKSNDKYQHKNDSKRLNERLQNIGFKKTPKAEVIKAESDSGDFFQALSVYCCFLPFDDTPDEYISVSYENTDGKVKMTRYMYDTFKEYSILKVW